MQIEFGCPGLLLDSAGDWIGPMVGGIVAALVAALAAAKARRKRSGARGHNRHKEKDMTYIPIITGGGGSHGGTIEYSSSKGSKIHPIAVFWFIIWLLAALIWFIVGLIRGADSNNPPMVISALVGFGVGMIISFIFLFCLKVADQWDRVVVLRFGRFKAVQQPGVF